MWKKFLAVMATLSLLSTTAFALGGTPTPGAGTITSYIDNYAVSSATFDPVNDPAVTVSFDLASTASIYTYVINANYEIVATLMNYETAAAGKVSKTWNGKVGNVSTGAVLPDGDYMAKTFAVVDNAIADFDYKSIKISSQPVVNEAAPKISNLKVDPLMFSAAGDEDTEISFDVDKDAYLSVVVKSGSTTVKTFSDYSGNDWYKSTENHSINWDGTNDSSQVVAEGTYTVSVTAKNDDGENTLTTAVEVKTSGPVSDGVIENLKLDPKTTWNPVKEDLEIDFDLTSDVKSLTIDAKKGNNVVEILDDDFADDDDYEEAWDGTDDDGDYIDEGTWEIIVRADGDKVVQTIKVEYEKPEITSSFVTKESFDPTEDEFTNLVFKVDAAAVVTVEVYQGTSKEFTLLDEEDVKKNRYYAVAWDGMDEDGDEVDMGKDWKFKITAENSTDDDIFSTETVEVNVEEDDVSDKKANVTNDSTDPIVLDEDEDGNMEISYCLDLDAEVFLAVYDGSSTSGKAEAELLDYVSQESGCHTIEWNGKDDKGKDLKDGIYSYKLISKVGTQKDTETGKFVVGNAGDVNPKPEPEDAQCSNGVDDDGDGWTDYPYDPGCSSASDDDEFNSVEPPPYAGDCSMYYWDLAYLGADNELCEAIAWVTEEGIFSGYADGSFKPYQEINRAEVLKVVLEAFDTNLFPINGSNEGFSDVDAYAWYMPYVRTAVFYGMLDGYGDGTARLENNVNRVELLKFVLEASNAFTGYEFATGYYYPDSAYYYDFYADVAYDSNSMWFYDYANAAYQYELYNTYFVNGQEYLHPAQLVERGEVALLLYRMAKADLL